MNIQTYGKSSILRRITRAAKRIITPRTGYVTIAAEKAQIVPYFE